MKNEKYFFMLHIGVPDVPIGSSPRKMVFLMVFLHRSYGVPVLRKIATLRAQRSIEKQKQKFVLL
jgi:hypothetical protein